MIIQFEVTKKIRKSINSEVSVKEDDDLNLWVEKEIVVKEAALFNYMYIYYYFYLELRNESS